MNITDKKHFYCVICERRLDRVVSWYKVQKNELVFKLTRLKEGVKCGDRVCNRCFSRARSLPGSVETFENNIISTELNDESSINVQNNDNLEPLTLNDEIENENSQSCSDSDDSCDNNDDLTISSKSSIFVDLARTNYNNKKCMFCGKKRTIKTISYIELVIKLLLMLILKLAF